MHREQETPIYDAGGMVSGDIRGRLNLVASVIVLILGSQSDQMLAD
jgi:hypothetical protein